MTKDNTQKVMKKVQRNHKKVLHDIKKQVSDFKIEDGKSAVAMITMYDVDKTSQMVDCPFAGMIKYLGKETDCHAIYVNRSAVNNSASLIPTIKNELEKKNIRVVLFLAVTDEEIPNGVVLENSNNQNIDFVEKLVKYTFEYQLKQLEVEKNNVSIESFSKGTLMSLLSEDATYKCVNIIVNRNYFVQDSLFKIIKTLSNLDWNASEIGIYRLGQSRQHKPQDKVELYDDGMCKHKNYGFMGLCNYNELQEWVRLHYLEPKGLELSQKQSESLYMTNRLIERMYGREWIERNENEPGLEGIPVVLYTCTRDEYEIGITKANKIETVYFSTALYKELEKDAEKYNFAIFNKYTDSMLHIDFKKADTLEQAKEFLDI